MKKDILKFFRCCLGRFLWITHLDVYLDNHPKEYMKQGGFFVGLGITSFFAPTILVLKIPLSFSVFETISITFTCYLLIGLICNVYIKKFLGKSSFIPD